jgi:hypothetical protein
METLKELWRIITTPIRQVIASFQDVCCKLFVEASKASVATHFASLGLAARVIGPYSYVLATIGLLCHGYGFFYSLALGVAPAASVVCAMVGGIELMVAYGYYLLVTNPDLQQVYGVSVVTTRPATVVP